MIFPSLATNSHANALVTKSLHPRPRGTYPAICTNGSAMGVNIIVRTYLVNDSWNLDEVIY